MSNRKLYQAQNLNNLGLKRLLEIKANQYRSKDNSQDYCPFTVDARIIEIQVKQAEKLTFNFEMPSNEAIFFPPAFNKLKKLVKKIKITLKKYMPVFKADRNKHDDSSNNTYTFDAAADRRNCWIFANHRYLDRDSSDSYPLNLRYPS